MPGKKTKRTTSGSSPKDAAPLSRQLQDAIAQLEKMGTARGRASLVRFGIDAPNAFGVAMADIQKFAKRLGKNHELALLLWDTKQYEARLLAAYVGEPEALTGAQMDRLARDFDNWAVCDTICFVLFDRSKHAWGRVATWCGKREEFVRRAGFALLACLAGHDKNATDTQFLESLPLIERGAMDARNFVRKGVSWAMRRIGWRSQSLHEAAVALATKLANSEDPASRWVGKDALRDLTRAAMVKRLIARESSSNATSRKGRNPTS